MKIWDASVGYEDFRVAMTNMAELYDVIRAARCRDQGEETHTRTEAVAQEILGLLAPDENCRIILEYKPDKETIHVCREFGYDRGEKELLPWEAEEQLKNYTGGGTSTS